MQVTVEGAEQLSNCRGQSMRLLAPGWVDQEAESRHVVGQTIKLKGPPLMTHFLQRGFASWRFFNLPKHHYQPGSKPSSSEPIWDISLSTRNQVLGSIQNNYVQTWSTQSEQAISTASPLFSSLISNVHYLPDTMLKPHAQSGKQIVQGCKPG